MLPPTLHSCRSLSKSFGPSPSPLALCRGVFIVGVCPISVPFGVALLLFAALNACCHARARGCILCTLDIPYVCFAPRDVALAKCTLSPCHRRAEPHAVMMPVGRLFNRNEWLSWSWMCGGCGVGVLFSGVAGFVAPCAFLLYHADLCSCQRPS